MWFGWLLASPLYLLVAPRGFGYVLLDVAGIVANSFLVGFGTAGGIRLLARRGFGVGFLFIVMTLTAILCYATTLSGDSEIILLLSVATIALAILSVQGITTNRQRVSRTDE